ncbi:hypothetical protein OIU84_011032 [Salix udensis]|uniref:DUF7356 domain-containing protein n=1 Tax=Salix udensis TaxID=889485 RepID=A0AAD6JNK2_9ROSI|nr:hypothetical protein OIU84_011032 [Salix udensis]
MDRNGILRLLWLLFFLFSDASNASFVSKIRQLAALKDGNNPVQIQVSPSPSPVPANTLNTTKPEGNSVLKADNSTSMNNSSIGSNIDNKSNNSDNNNTGIVGPSSIPGNKTAREDEKNNDETKKVSEEKDHHKTDSEAEVGGENCTTLGTKRCTDLKSMSACILGFDSEFHWWTVLIQNSGEHNLSVDVVAPNSADNALVLVGKHQSKKINLTVGENTEVKLNATKWGMKRRREAGTAYQELEMAMPESGVANIVETAEGWDKDWDDNWDEENAIKSPASRHSASVSANGLTSRSSNKDGWDNDWDD